MLLKVNVSEVLEAFASIIRGMRAPRRWTQERLPGQGHVPGQGMVINRHGMARIEIAIDLGGAKQCIVMDLSEIEDIILDEIDGTGSGAVLED